MTFNNIQNLGLPSSLLPFRQADNVLRVVSETRLRQAVFLSNFHSDTTMKKASPAITGQPKRRAPRAIPANLTDKEAVLNLLLQLANQFNLICSLPDVEGNVYLTAETGESLTMLFYDQIKGEA